MANPDADRGARRISFIWCCMPRSEVAELKAPPPLSGARREAAQEETANPFHPLAVGAAHRTHANPLHGGGRKAVAPKPADRAPRSMYTDANGVLHIPEEPSSDELRASRAATRVPSVSDVAGLPSSTVASMSLYSATPTIRRNLMAARERSVVRARPAAPPAPRVAAAAAAAVELHRQRRLDRLSSAFGSEDSPALHLAHLSSPPPRAVPLSQLPRNPSNISTLSGLSGGSTDGAAGGGGGRGRVGGEGEEASSGGVFEDVTPAASPSAPIVLDVRGGGGSGASSARAVKGAPLGLLLSAIASARALATDGGGGGVPSQGLAPSRSAGGDSGAAVLHLLTSTGNGAPVTSAPLRVPVIPPSAADPAATTSDSTGAAAAGGAAAANANANANANASATAARAASSATGTAAALVPPGAPRRPVQPTTSGTCAAATLTGPGTPARPPSSGTLAPASPSVLGSLRTWNSSRISLGAAALPTTGGALGSAAAAAAAAVAAVAAEAPTREPPMLIPLQCPLRIAEPQQHNEQQQQQQLLQNEGEGRAAEPTPQ